MLITLICCNYYNYLSNFLSSSLIYDDLWLWEFVFARTDLPRSPSSKALISATTRLGAISPSSPVRPKTVLELKRFSFAELQHFGRSSLVWRRFKFPIRSLCWYAIFWMSHEQNNFKGIPKKKLLPRVPSWGQAISEHEPASLSSPSHGLPPNCSILVLPRWVTLCHITHHCTTFTQQSFKIFEIHSGYLT